MLRRFIVVIILILIVFVFILYNILQRYRNKCREKRIAFENLLNKRWNLVPLLVNILEKYSVLEQPILDKLNILKNTNYDTLKLEQKIEIDKTVSKVISKMFEISDKNEDLKENEEYIELKNQLMKIDGNINKDKKEHHSIAEKYNKIINKFPVNLVAILFGFNDEVKI